MHHSTETSAPASTRQLTRAERIRFSRAATGLKPAEKLLLRALVDFMGNSDECWPSLSRLAEEVGVSVRHVRRMLRSLEAAGWIVTRYRFRPDRSQASCVFTWAKVPDLHVRPPRTSVSALEINIGTIQQNTYAAPAECDSVPEEKPAAEDVQKCTSTQKDAAELPAADPPACRPTVGQYPSVGAQICAATQTEAAELPPVTSAERPEKASRPAAPTTRGKAASPRFIVIDGTRFLDIKEAERVYHASVAGRFINSGTVDRLAFFACWCAVAAKVRAGVVRHPERMMRFLLDNRKAMSAYPDHAAELKAREAVRFLFPEKHYNPHS